MQFNLAPSTFLYPARSSQPCSNTTLLLSHPFSNLRSGSRFHHHTTNPNDAKYEEDHTNDAKYEEDHTNDAKYEEDHTNDAKYEEDHTNDAKYEEDHTNDAKYEEDHTNDAKYEEDHTNDAKYEELRLKLEQKVTFDVDLMMSGTKRTGLKNTRISKQEYLRERC
ncbi:hypothetical protein BLNAU_14428 [Blattamonas nauphoetae]|uniref:Uncharacterized protein n=1 Tax=Blattamonas nauphoetae TaxID=2049346 RepID=A0ABQ9XJ29_9EUKA|nr:hypothetical protein BLNAU_14428 [Blattamonas nauphoetae]